MKDYYHILELESPSIQKDIKSACRRLSMGYHPDRSGSEELMKELNKSDSVLGDPAKKAACDRDYETAFCRKESSRRSAQHADKQPESEAYAEEEFTCPPLMLDFTNQTLFMNMIHKSTAAVALLLLATTSMSAQTTVSMNLNGAATNKIPTTTILKGQELTVTSVTCDMSSQKGYDYILGVRNSAGQDLQLDLAKVTMMPVEFTATTKDEYWYGRSIQKTLPSLSKMMNAYSMRNKAETSANQAVGKLRSNALIIDDPYLTSYINSLLVKINPTQRLDFFKYNFKVVIAKDDTPNAGIYPNGALVINAGMLARIHTEDELVALLCHEANHFICNHYLDNLAKIQKRQTAGAIGSAVLGVAAGVLTGSASVGLSTGSLSMDAANNINALVTAMGLSFDQTQEKESDQAAVDLLPILGYDQNAMATCIQTIGNYYMEEGNLAAYYKSGSHPKIEDRLAATGIPYERRDSTFEKKMAPCVSFVAQQMYAKGRYSQALDIAGQNISNGVGRGMDYHIKGECLLAAFDSDETNAEARESLLKARETYTDDLPTLKALIVADLRLGLRYEAKSLLEEFTTLAKDKEEERIWARSIMQNIGE